MPHGRCHLNGPLLRSWWPLYNHTVAYTPGSSFKRQQRHRQSVRVIVRMRRLPEPPVRLRLVRPGHRACSPANVINLLSINQFKSCLRDQYQLHIIDILHTFCSMDRIALVSDSALVPEGQRRSKISIKTISWSNSSGSRSKQFFPLELLMLSLGSSQGN